MSFPFQKGDTSPQSSSYYSSDISSPRGQSPIWKSSKRKGLQIDWSKVLQLVSVVAAIGVFFLLLRSIIPGGGRQEDFAALKNPDRNHFIQFEGGLDCRISSQDLYTPPKLDDPKEKKKLPICKNRATLLEALSHGGRHGFDAPYTPKGCHFKWYTEIEICMILERFDGVVFIGDELVHQIYAAFNILMRQDLALGGLQQWRMSAKEKDSCRCDHQFTKPDCSKYYVSSNDEVAEEDAKSDYRAPYKCNRTPHFYLRVHDSPAAADQKFKFAELLNKDPHSWKPIAIIQSLGLSTGFRWQVATESMDEWLTIADESGRNSPFLWLGPNAAGHLKPPDKIMQEGNNALWHYTIEMGKEAARRGVDHLALYNSTLQASSFDGSSYGERVALVHAMEIMNWLARLETT